MKIGKLQLETGFKLAIPSFVVLLVAEFLLRIFGVAPSGFFDFMLPTADGGLYPRNSTIEHNWGPIPYVSHTDSLGLRKIDSTKPLSSSCVRIITIGDSVTEGYFVDNSATYPHFLQRLLDQCKNETYQVLNAARGGGSIDKELAILKKIALPLRPKFAILTFVTNDIADLRGKTRLQILNHRLQFDHANVPAHHRVAFWAWSKTALGEAIYRLYWHLKYTRRYGKPAGRGDGRYIIDGGTDFARNAEIFRNSCSNSDGIVLSAEFSQEARNLIDNYLFGLEKFIVTCRSSDITPVFVFFPAYSQIYDRSASLAIRDLLRDDCQRLSVPFVDLTPTFRTWGTVEPIHLAPVDYHLNPRGNEIMGRAIFDFLRAQKLIDPGHISGD